MKKNIIAALLILILLVVGSGCSSTSDDKVSAPKSGGQVITIGMAHDVDTMNVLYTSSGNALAVAKLVQRGLFWYDENANLVPELAYEIPSLENGGISQDFQTITYKLREGVKWHDGQPVTSADVKFTWEAIMNPKNAVISRYGYEKIESIDTPDESTVVVRFKEVFAPWATLFDSILPKHILSSAETLNDHPFNRKPIGFGPLKIVEWISGDHIAFEANTDYWNGAPKISKLFIRFTPSREATLNAMEAGDIDIAWGLSEANIPDIESMKQYGIKLVTSATTNSERYTFNGSWARKTPPFDNKDVRRAIFMAIDRQTIIDKLLYGKSKIGVSDWGNSPYENKDLKPIPYDPEASKKILDDLGWKVNPTTGYREKDGKRLSFTHTTNFGEKLREDAQLLVQQNLKDIGVEMVIKNGEVGMLFAPYAQGGTWCQGDYQMGGWSISMRNPDPDLAVRFASSGIPSEENPSGVNWAHYSNPEVDKLFEEQSKTLDQEARKQIILKIQEHISEDYMILYLYSRLGVYAIKDTIQNFKPIPFGDFAWNIQMWEVSDR